MNNLPFLKRKWFWILAISTFFVILIPTWLLTHFNIFPALPSVLVAWGTLLLAISTFSLISEGKSSEARDRKERYINEFIKYIEDITDTELHKEIPQYFTPEEYKSYQLNNFRKYLSLYSKKYSILSIANDLPSDVSKGADELFKTFNIFCF